MEYEAAAERDYDLLVYSVDITFETLAGAMEQRIKGKLQRVEQVPMGVLPSGGHTVQMMRVLPSSACTGEE